MIRLALILVAVPLILSLFAFVLYSVFLPLLRTVLGGLQAIEVFASRRDELTTEKRQLHWPGDS
jgi:hypothetical protein